MSLEQTIDKNWDEIVRKRETVSEALSWSESGKKVDHMSREFAQTSQMKAVMQALSNPDSYPIDRFKMSQYFAQALEGDIATNIMRYIEYLENIADIATEDKRRDYYRNVRKAVLNLHGSEALTNYISVYNNFQRDASEEAMLARGVIRKVTQSVRALMGEYAND